MRQLFVKVHVLFITLVVAAVASAQTARPALNGHATLTGQVADTTGAVLQGAQILVKPVGVVVASNQQGEFTVTNLAPGTYTVVVSYVGFKDFTANVQFEGSEAHRVMVKLDVESQTEDIVVTAERPHGEAEAINRTRTADNIVQVLPQEVITSLPNANVADALGRLPSVTLARDEGEGVYVQVRGTEPRLTNVTINGITIPSPEPTVRQVRLDALAADLVESVEINKTLSANQDGDGIGGSVNLRTKTANEQMLALSALGGYNPILGGRGNDQFGITAARRFGPQKQLGVLVGLAYDWNGRGIDDIEPGINPTVSTMAAPFYDNNTVREYRYYRTRQGGTGSGDYKLSDSSLIRASGIFSAIKDYGDKWYYSPAASGAPKFYTSSKSPEYAIGSFDVSGKHLIGGSWFTWDGAVAHASQSASAGNPKADFSWLPATLNCGFTPSAQTNVYLPTFGSNCDGANTPLQNAANWGLKDLTTSDGSTAQLNLSANAGAGFNYQAGGHPSTLEVGGKIRNAHKDQNASEVVYDGWKAASYPMTNGLLDGFNSTNYYDNSYYGGHYGPVSNFNSVVNLVNTQLSSFVDGYKTAANTLPNIFNTTERIGAVYAMNTIDFNKVRLQAGLRIESTQMQANGSLVTLYPAGSKNCPTPTGCGTASPVSTTPSYTDALPSVQMKYAITENSNLRLAYGRGISRPDAYQLVPYATIDDSTNPSTTSIGNSALKPSHANNYDVLFEQFLQPVGMIQAGLFYKQISDPLVTDVYTPASGQYAGQLVTQWINAGSAYIYGFELSYQQHLTRLPGGLAGIGVFANYSRTASQIDSLPGRTDSPALQRQTPDTWNLSPTYDRGPLSFRLGLTYNGPSIFQYAYTTAADPAHLGPAGPAGDEYTYPHLQVDAQAVFALTHSLRMTVYGLNLSNEVYGLYAGSEQFVRQREFYKPTVAFGIRYVF